MCSRTIATGERLFDDAAGWQLTIEARPGRGYWASRDPFVVPARRDVMRLASAAGTLGICPRGAAAGVGRRGGAAGGVRSGRGYWASRDPFVVPACRDVMRLTSAAGTLGICPRGWGARGGA